MDFFTALHYLKASIDTLNAVVGTSNRVKIDAAIADVTTKYRDAVDASLEAAQSRITLVERLEAANTEITRLNGECQNLQTKAERAQDYKIVALSENVLVYQAKEGNSNGDAAHYVCQGCLDTKGDRFALQRIGGSRDLKCPGCSTVYDTDPPATRGRQPRQAFTDDDPDNWRTF